MTGSPVTTLPHALTNQSVIRSGKRDPFGSDSTHRVGPGADDVEGLAGDQREATRRWRVTWYSLSLSRPSTCSVVITRNSSATSTPRTADKPVGRWVVDAEDAVLCMDTTVHRPPPARP